MCHTPTPWGESMKTDKTENYARTAAALAELDAKGLKPYPHWDGVGITLTKADVDYLAALRVVQLAFYEDTKHRNRIADCLRTTEGFLRWSVNRAALNN